MTTGLHHVTLITRKVQDNVDFYAGFLGLRLVKQTAGFEDGQQLHLFYGDQAGSPGSLITFLVWEDGAPGRVGHGQVGEIALAVPPGSIGDWLARALSAHVPVQGPMREFGETVLRLKDPDGVSVKLVGLDLPAAAPLPDPIAPTRLRSVTLFSEDADQTADFAARFGYREAARDGVLRRMTSDSDAIDIRDAGGFFGGIPGTGTADHLALRAPDADAVRQMRLSLRDAADITHVHDRKYFLSLYARDPAGILFEYATDAPGMAVDEPIDQLGRTLMIPPHDSDRADDLRVMLPQFALPGEERIPMRDLPFTHRFHTPDDPDGSVILLLHGTGGNEADLMPLARRLNPRATLLGVRGRSNEEGIARWFRRYDMMRFDQDDIRSEAKAFDAFMAGALKSYGLDPDRLTVLGFSNGANFAGALMALYPGLFSRAILIRAMPVLEDTPKADLKGTRVLLLNGARDPYGRDAALLENWLRDSGADLDARVLDAGHEMTPEDLTIAKDWLGAG